jgi:hypothetical protein
MSGLESWPVLAIVGLGALHGLNPAMGWLFAVALGLQEGSARAVWRALPPLALGHAASVALLVAAAALAGAFVPGVALRAVLAGVLIGFGLHRLIRGHRPSGFGGMRVGPRDLFAWSFLMATAHGAGLMVMPFVVGADGAAALAATAHGEHAQHLAQLTGSAEAAATGGALLASVAGGQLAGIAASLLHTFSYLVVAGLLAVVVYEKAGVRLLRTAWINLDLVWAAALIVTGVVVMGQLL